MVPPACLFLSSPLIHGYAAPLLTPIASIVPGDAQRDFYKHLPTDKKNQVLRVFLGIHPYLQAPVNVTCVRSTRCVVRKD